MRGRAVISIFALGLFFGGCSGCEQQNGEDPRADAGIRRRVLRPPPGQVRAIPPHNIYENGIGPYQLGAALKEVLTLLPHGPRVELLRVPGLVDYSLVRAEEGAVLVGAAPPRGVQFVAAIAEHIARTAEGHGVGATVADLAAELGAAIEQGNIASDPRLVRFAGLERAQFVIEDGRARAVVVTVAAELPAAAASNCPAAEAEPSDPSLVQISQLGKGRVLRGCFGGQPGAIVVAEDRYALLRSEGGAFRVVLTEQVPGLAFAAPIDTTGDGAHEVAIVSRRRTTGGLAARVRVGRVDGSRLLGLVDSEIYRLDADQARWVGVRLEDADLLLTLVADGNSIRVGGLYVQMSGRELQNLAPLSPVVLPLPGPRSPPAKGGERKPPREP